MIGVVRDFFKPITKEAVQNKSGIKPNEYESIFEEVTREIWGFTK